MRASVGRAERVPRLALVPLDGTGIGTEDDGWGGAFAAPARVVLAVVCTWSAGDSCRVGVPRRLGGVGYDAIEGSWARCVWARRRRREAEPGKVGVGDTANRQK